MEEGSVLSLASGKEYLILDVITLKDEKYLYCVQIDEEEMPTKEYKYFKSRGNDDEVEVEEVKDKEIVNALTTLFTANNLVDVTNEEQAA